MLSDVEWAQVAGQIMDRTGLAPTGDELGVRWVAVRHAADHIHLVATLARQDGTPNRASAFWQACEELPLRARPGRRSPLRGCWPVSGTSAR
jgi:hypothetical protein